MPSQNDGENEPVFVIHRAVERLRGPDMTDLDWEVLAGEIDAISLDRSEFHGPGAKLESKFSDSERSRALKDLQAAIRSRDKNRVTTEAWLALMAWGG
jgi:hypothetical protein